jgi:hypothetical protein
MKVKFLLLACTLSGCSSGVGATEELMNHFGITGQATNSEQQQAEVQQQYIPLPVQPQQIEPPQEEQPIYAPVPEQPKPKPKENHNRYYVTALDGSLNSAYVVQVPPNTTIDQVRPITSDRPFVRFLAGDDRFAYSSFIAEKREDPEVTIDNVKNSFGFEKIYDEVSCGVSSDFLCHEYRAHNPDKGRVYLGRIYVVKDSSEVYTGHSLIASTLDTKELSDNGFVSSFKVQPVEVMKQCQSVETILAEEYQAMKQNNSDRKDMLANIAEALTKLSENDNSEAGRLIVELAQSYQAIANGYNIQNAVQKARDLDRFCYVP